MLSSQFTVCSGVQLMTLPVLSLTARALALGAGVPQTVNNTALIMIDPPFAQHIPERER